MSKNASVILFVLAFLAIGFLYYKEYSAPAVPNVTEDKITTTDSTRAKPDQDLRVAFIYGDSINKNYTFSIKTMERLAREQKSAEERVRAKLNRAQQRYQQLMEQSQTMTQSEVQQAQAELQQMEQEMQAYQQNIAAELQQSEIDAQTEYLKRVQDFLQEFNQVQKYDVIFNYQQGGSILKMDSAYDITEEVIRGLNKNFEAEQAEDSKAKK